MLRTQILVAHATIFMGVLSAADIHRPDHRTFQSSIQPFVNKHCAACHNAKLNSGEVNLTSYADASALTEARDVWEEVLHKVRTGEMPPKGIPKPPADDVKVVLRWLENEFERIDRAAKPDPGRVTARRLNRSEYNNTIRDLLDVDFHPAEDFPADDAGYGFDNIGDVLSLSPVLMEKYLAAAEDIAKRAIHADPPMKPLLERYQAERLNLAEKGVVQAKHVFPVEAEYDIKIGQTGRPPDGAEYKIGLWLNGKQIHVIDFKVVANRPRIGDYRASIPAGRHELRAAVIFDGATPESIKPDPNRIIDPTGKTPNPTPQVDFVEIRGPYNPVPPPPPASHRRVFVCGHGNNGHSGECARQIMKSLARRAYRRPVSQSEVSALVRFVKMAQAEGDTFEQGIRVGLQAILVSPHFLFRIERHPAPLDPGAIHPIDEYEFATRLAYFLWSSMPDEELSALAGQGSLRKPGILEAQVARMLLDPRAKALVDNFAGQWLQLRNLDSIQPDPDRFPSFDAELRDAMRQETALFFETIVKEDRSVLEFLDARYTFLNERLAKHYNIPGVTGPDFRRVSLSAPGRGGVLTHASVLTISSYPTRTSPVMRGKWILENLLNAPPPPPPPGVSNLNEEAVGNTGSLRQQLEKHRADPTCAACHARMDPLGFGLENFDAIGKWRTRDGKFPVDAAGVLPNGQAFSGPADLKKILLSERDAFAQCLTEKLLTYAIGRGLERYDRPAVNSISRSLAANGYRFSRLVLEIVNSMPFQMRRGEEGER